MHWQNSEFESNNTINWQHLAYSLTRVELVGFIRVILLALQVSLVVVVRYGLLSSEI